MHVYKCVCEAEKDSPAASLFLFLFCPPLLTFFEGTYAYNGMEKVLEGQP